MALYQQMPLTALPVANTSAVLRTSDNTTIPFDPGNVDYQAYQEWLAAGNVPDPAPALAPVTQMSPLVFIGRFTAAEQAAVAAAAQTSAAMLLWLTQLSAAQYIDVTDPRTIAGINMLVTAGLLTADRVPEILATVS